MSAGGQWIRVRTGVARTLAGWQVIARRGDGPVEPVGPVYATEAEADEAARFVAAEFRRRFTHKDTP